MSLDDLRAFCTLAETLHFGRAAGQLGMSPSALSRTLQRLEQALGQRLLIRDKRNVSLCPAGELLLAHARRQLDAHAGLLQQLAAEARDPAGQLRIACTVTACHSILPELLARCRRRYPRIALQLVTSDAVEALARLRRGEAHVAVVPEPAQPATLAFAPLAQTPLRVIAPGSEPAISEAATRGGPALQQVPVLLPHSGLERERFTGWLAAHGVTAPQVYAEVNGNEAIIAMVSLGCGLGLVPELVLAASPLRQTVTTPAVAHAPSGYRVGLCAPRRRLDRPALAAFWELACESTAASPGVIGGVQLRE